MLKKAALLGLLMALLSCTYPPKREEAQGGTYQRMKAYLDSIPAIDTHDHLSDARVHIVNTDKGPQVTLYGLWKQSYYPWINPLTVWENGKSFDEWWKRAKHDFRNARATTFYRYMLPAFQDLYGVDFDTVTDEQARELNEKIARNHRDVKWTYEVVTKKANIELVLNDPYWEAIDHELQYSFEVLVLNVANLIHGFHESEFRSPHDNLYGWARKQGPEIRTLDDYLAALDRLFGWAKKRGAVAAKSAIAYQRTLLFERVTKEAAQAVFGRPRGELTPEQVKTFEDFIMWEMVRLCSKHDMPFQIHTGHARIQGSNPMNLVDLIQANRGTKFILFHGGYPWVGEIGAIVHRYPHNVWIDSVWMPTISFTMAKRAFHEWLDLMPSDRILWGADSGHAEGVYGATEFTRRCLAEVLAERVDRGELREAEARKIGLQILRNNALAVYPQLNSKLWRHTGKYPEPPAK